MEAQSMALRHAIQLLYSASNRSDQQRADTWLQDFRNQGEAYILCLELLVSPSVSEPEAYFAANTLRYACSRSTQLIAPDIAAQLIPKIVICLFDAYSKSKWTVASQLSSGLALLMVRMPSWSPHSMIIDLEKLLASQLAQYLQAVQQQQSSVAHLTTLHVLAALPAACTDKHCSVPPNRRLIVSEALASSPHIHPWIQTAFLAYEQHQAPQMQHLYLNLGMQLIHGWCELGCLPIVLPQQLSILQHVCRAALSQETAGTGAETLVSVITVIKDVASQGSDLLLLVVQCWQDALNQLTAETQGASLNHDVLQSMCLVLCSIASALLPFALGPDNQLKTQFIRVAEQLMSHLTSTDDDVALTALEFWQDTYLTSLQGLPNAARQVAINSHTQLLQALTAGLVLRSQLDYKTAIKATADARDLPEEVRLVRRELASALRDITSLVGLGSMSQYLAALVQVQWVAFTDAIRMPGQANAANWTALECMLYAANVVLGQSGQAKRREPPNSVAVQLLVEICVACLMQAEDPAAAPKLLGTALTLLGGLGNWFLEQQDALLRSVLNALIVALKASNDKLARNAATTVYRLCQNRPVAAHVLINHSAWVEGLLQHYQATGGVQRRVGSGSDLATEELLLATLCKLAMQPASSNLSFGSNLLLHLTQPKLQELRQALSSLVLCAPMALNMLANAATPVASAADALKQAVQQQGSTQSPALHQATQQAQVQAIQQAAQQAQALQHAAQQAQAQAQQQGQQGGGMPQATQQADGSTINDLTQAVALANQAGVCLEVLNMAVENATATPKNKELMGTLSTATSVSESPRGEREYIGGYPGAGGGLQPSMSLESRGSVSDMSRTPSFTGGASSMNGQVQLTAAECACAEQVITLVRNVWSILQSCLAQLQSLPLIMGSACDMFACALRNLPPPLQPELHVLSVQLLACLPPRVLTSPKCLSLLSAVLEVYGANRPSSPSNPQLARSEPSPANGSASSPSRNTPAVTTQTLLNVSQSAVLHSCQQVMGSSDPDLIIPVIGLCKTVLERLPIAFTNASTVDVVLNMTRTTARSYDIEQCRHWLDWVLQLMSAPFVGTARPRPTVQSLQTSHMTGAMGVGANNLALALNRNMTYNIQGGGMMQQVLSSGGAAPGLVPPGPSQEGLELLALQLEGSTGPQLMLALLMAASGDMPPDLVQYIGAVVHQVWTAVGSKRFNPWIEKAVLDLARDHDTPWAKQRYDVKVAALQELVCQETEHDIGRFKKLFKSFCRGKKSFGVNSLPNSRNLSRQSSFMSASNHVNV